MTPSNKYIIDTNVPVTANLASNLGTIEDPDMLLCALRCLEAIEHVMKHDGLVLDAGDEIFDEYRHNLSLDGQPGIGDHFMKWVYLNRWRFPAEDRVTLKKVDGFYVDFPQVAGLDEFDPSDRKFIALANAHPEKPPILQATDSKWWGWKEALDAAGITVDFICPTCIEEKYRQKVLGEK